MELPLFNGQATGPQGAAGIPPEHFGAKGIQESALKQIGAEIRPEDSAPVQQAMDQEAAALANQLIGDENNQPQQQAPENAPDTPATQPNEPVRSVEPIAAKPDQTPDGRSEKVQAVIDKYGEDLDKIAEAYAHTNAARTRAQQKNSDLGGMVATLADKVDSLSSQMNAAMTPQTREYDPAPETFAAPPATPDTPSGDGNQEFWTNPEQSINRIFQKNMLAVKEAEQRVQQRRKFDRIQADPETARLRPIMASLYNEDRATYDLLPQDRALSLLVDRAKDRDYVGRALEFYEQVKGTDGTAPAGTPGARPAPESGALPQGASSRHATNSPAAAQGRWAETPAFKRLWKTGDGSTDEMRAITDTLKERGFGDHVVIR